MGFTSEIYLGQTIRYNNELYTVIGKEFAAMGKGSSFNRTRLRNIVSGKVIPVTFKDADTVEEIDVDKFNVQYLYNDDRIAYFMNPKNFEQFEVALDIVPGGTDYLHADASYMASRYEDKIIAITVPLKIVLEVTDAPEGVRGDTVSNTFKEVIVETGAKIQAPLFIKTGDKIYINTEAGTYVSKA